MGDWENLPIDLLSHLYLYLPRRDRLSCSLVCKKWRDGLDHVILWKTVVVHMDTDLMEPSTILLLRDYCKYIKNLEFGWAVPHKTKMALMDYKELTKRAVRFFLILYDNYIQVTSLRFFNWFDFMSFRKVTYHIARFLKNQIGLKKITFDNINMHSVNYMKLLSACLVSRSTIVNLDIRTCYYCQSSFDSVYLRSCIEQLSYLKIFKLDYFILSCKVIDAILTSRNRSLEHLELILKETTWQDHVVDDEQWCLLCSACPNLKVTMFIKNIYHYGELRVYLKQSIPIVSLSFVLPCVLDKGGRCHFRKTLNLFVNNYYRTLEHIHLSINNYGLDYSENVDDLLLTMLRRCSGIKNFVFKGYLDNPLAFKTNFENIDYHCPPLGYPDNPGLLEDTFFNEDMRHKRVQFTFIKRKPDDVCSLFILN